MEIVEKADKEQEEKSTRLNYVTHLSLAEKAVAVSSIGIFRSLVILCTSAQGNIDL